MIAVYHNMVNVFSTSIAVSVDFVQNELLRKPCLHMLEGEAAVLRRGCSGLVRHAAVYGERMTE